MNRFVKNGKANFGSPNKGNSKYSGQKKPKWIFHLTSTEISGTNLKVLAKFGLCSNCSQKLDECSLARQLTKFLQVLACSDFRLNSLIVRSFMEKCFLVLLTFETDRPKFSFESVSHNTWRKTS